MKFGTQHPRCWRGAAALVLAPMVWATLFAASAPGSEGPALEDLKGRVANASIADRPPLCLQISELQIGAAGRFYDMGDIEQAKAALTDVVAFSELARDYSIQSHRHEKNSEIAIRKMTRKLTDLKHTVSHEDQEQVQKAIDRLQRIRDDLLVAMFPKVGKK
jgi:hypothetical protein